MVKHKKVLMKLIILIEAGALALVLNRVVALVLVGLLIILSSLLRKFCFHLKMQSPFFSDWSNLKRFSKGKSVMLPSYENELRPENEESVWNLELNSKIIIS